MYDELVKRVRQVAEEVCDDYDVDPYVAEQRFFVIEEAANAIEKLLKVASAMHTWIFLNTGDEQKAYDECGLSDEMNAALGYIGQFVAEPPKEE